MEAWRGGCSVDIPNPNMMMVGNWGNSVGLGKSRRVYSAVELLDRVFGLEV